MLPSRKTPDPARELDALVDGIQVRGDVEFCARTRESLALLNQTPAWARVRSQVKVIRQGRRSGMRAWAKNPMFVVGSATWRHSPLWYAGAIAHDAFHARLYSEAKEKTGGREPPAESWTGTVAEQKCLAFQSEVLQALQCEESILRYLSDCTRDPAYQGRRGVLVSWLDYRKRWW